MFSSKLAEKTIQVSRGHTYTYYTSPAKDGKPTIILFHGWPDEARLWTGIVNDYLVPHGYGVVAPDCLGYGATSKPTEPREYPFLHQTRDMMEILDAEGIDQVVSMGHDWGSMLCQRLYNFFPSRVRGVVLVNVAYIPPSGAEFDLAAANKAMRQVFDGHGLYEYWELFAAEDGPEIMNANLESVYTVAFGEPATWLENWTQPGAMRRYVSEGRTQPVLPFADAEHKKRFMDRLGRDGFEAPQCWYRSTAQGFERETNKSIADGDKVVHVPVFFWGGEQDFVCRPSLLQPSVDAGLLPDLKSKTREGGHWALLEKPKEFGDDVLEWLEETYAVRS